MLVDIRSMSNVVVIFSHDIHGTSGRLLLDCNVDPWFFVSVLNGGRDASIPIYFARPVEEQRDWLSSTGSLCGWLWAAP